MQFDRRNQQKNTSGFSRRATDSEIKTEAYDDDIRDNVEGRQNVVVDDFRVDLENRIRAIGDKNLRNILLDMNRGEAYIEPIDEAAIEVERQRREAFDKMHG